MTKEDDAPAVDPRFTLSNERTFLSWIRTAMALIATGVAIEALAPPLNPALRLAGAALFTVLGMVAAIQAWFGWRRSDRALREGQELPAPATAAFITAGVIAGVGLLALGLVV
jgi:putative membrane protein